MSDKLIERIERYLDGDLNEQEKSTFELDLQQDTALSDAFERYLRDLQLMTDENAPSDQAQEAEVPQANRQETDVFEDKIKTQETESQDLDLQEPADLPEAAPEKRPFSQRIRPLAVFLLGISLYFLVQKACADKPMPETYFPPSSEPSAAVAEDLDQTASILDDMEKREEEADISMATEDEFTAKGEALPLDTNAIGNAPPPPPPTKREKKSCQTLLSEADAYYKDADYERAQLPLIEIIQEENSACQGDAWFHLARIRLKLGDPQFALECLAKVDNLDKYGQDVQWYMALCFYEKAKQDESQRSRAAGALKRVLSTPQPAERLETARKLLEEIEG